MHKNSSQNCIRLGFDSQKGIMHHSGIPQEYVKIFNQLVPGFNQLYVYGYSIYYFLNALNHFGLQYSMTDNAQDELNKLFAYYNWRYYSDILDDHTRLNLRNYQKEAVIYSFFRRGSIIKHDMGLGKTITAITSAYLKILDGQGDRVYVICPASLIQKWSLEITKTLKHRIDNLTIIGTKEQRKELHRMKATWKIMSYECFTNDKYVNYNNAIIIYDEVHYLKNYSAKRTERARDIVQNVSSAIGLTGHKIYKLEQVHSMVTCLWKQFFSSTRGFLTQYCNYHESGKYIVSYRNEHEVANAMPLIQVVRTKEEALPELPDKTYEIRLISMSAQEKKLYRQIKNGKVTLKDKVKEKNINEAIILAKITYLKQFLDSPAIIDTSWPLKGAKIRELEGLLEDIDRRVVIFTQYKASVNILQNILDPTGKMSYTYTGETTDSELYRKWILSDRKYFIMDIAGAYGIDLHGTYDENQNWVPGADVVIFFDEHDDPGVNAQVEDRIHRYIDNKEIMHKWHCHIIKLRVEKSYEEARADILWKKKEFARFLLGKEYNEQIKNKIFDLI